MTFLFAELDLCSLNDQAASEDCEVETLMPSISPIDDDYIAKLELELKVLKAMKGFTGPDPKGRLLRAKPAQESALVVTNNLLEQCFFNSRSTIEDIFFWVYHCSLHDESHDWTER